MPRACSYRGVFKWPKNDHHIYSNITPWNTCHIYPCIRTWIMCNTYQILFPPPTSFIIFDFEKNTYIHINQALCYSVSVCLTVGCHHSHIISVLSRYTVTDMSLSVCMPHSLVSTVTLSQYYRSTQSLTCHSVSVCSTVLCQQSHYLSIIIVHSHWHVTQCLYAPQSCVNSHIISVLS